MNIALRCTTSDKIFIFFFGRYDYIWGIIYNVVIIIICFMICKKSLIVAAILILII